MKYWVGCPGVTNREEFWFKTLKEAIKKYEELIKVETLYHVEIRKGNEIIRSTYVE